MTEYSWSKLKEKCPIEIGDLKKHIDAIENAVNLTVNVENLNECKEKLIMASGELEILMTRLMTLLYDRDILQDETDKAIYLFLKDDVARYLGMIDEKQTQLLEVFDGMKDEKVGIGRTTAFKKIVQVALYGVVYYSLSFASDEYKKVKSFEVIEGDTTKKVNKKPNIFLRVLFLVMSISMSAVGGIPRTKSTGGMSMMQGRTVLPTAWKSLFSKSGENNIKEEYKQRYGEELKEDIGEFEDVMMEEYHDELD